MRIQYLGHSAFRLISEIGTTVVCDPFEEKMVGFAMSRVSADVVTESHHHGDHDNDGAVSGDPSILDCVVTCNADDVSIESFSCFHDDVHGKKRGANLVFKFLIDGIKVAHLGDLGEIESEEVANKLQGTDVLLIPVGGVYTVTAKQAKWYVDRIKPQIVIPMHYKTDLTRIPVAGVDEFTSLFDASTVEYCTTDFLTVDDLPENHKIVVMTVYRED